MNNQFLLSHQQRQLWNENKHCNVAIAINVNLEIDVQRFQKVLEIVCQEKEVFRTFYRHQEGFSEPFQVLESQVQVVSNEHVEENFEQVWENAIAYKFDLETGPLLWFSLAVISGKTNVICVHPALCGDRHSLCQLLDEAITNYKSPDSEKAKSEVAYLDYCSWQKEIDNESCLAAEKIWSEVSLSQTKNILPFLHWSSSSVCKYDESAQLEIPRSIFTNELTTSFSQEVWLLTCFQTLVWRLSQERSFPLGVVLSQRPEDELNSLIGLLASLGPLEIGRDDVSFISLLEENNRKLEKIYDVQHLLAQQAKMLPLLFEYHKDYFQNNSDIAFVQDHCHLFPFAIKMICIESEKNIRCQIFWNSEQVIDTNVSELQTFLQQFQHLLEQTLQNPKDSLTDFSLDWESSKPLTEPIIACEYLAIPQVFQEQVNKFYDSPAVVWQEEQWTYQQLNTHIRQIATLLKESNTNPGDVVAVSGEHDPVLIAAMLGVMSFGATLLTIAPELPKARKEKILELANARLLLNLNGKDEYAACPSKVVTLAVLDNFELLDLPPVDTKSPAYIFFTSGTTGEPKKVAGSHEALSHFLHWQKQEFQIGHQDRVALYTRLSFDVVMREVFLPLISGATLCIAPANIYESETFFSWLDERQVTILHTVPTLMNNWLSATPGDLTSKLRWIFFAGEALKKGLVEKTQQTFVDSQIANFYGPTETTLAKCFYVVPRQMPFLVAPIGQPLPQTQVFIMKGDQVCGANEVGEIVIRTPFHCLNTEEQSQVNRFGFRENPFLENELLYYSGDQGRIRYDGIIEILGRVDDQVKINGVRIDPLEIEKAIVQHSQVENAIVVVDKDNNGASLFAYITPNKPFDLREYLAQKIPAAMVPQKIIFTDGLPTTRHGKIDRSSLKDEKLESNSPQNITQKALLLMWQDLLDESEINIEDDFFELGGHSLHAFSLIAKIRSYFGKELSLEDLWDAPTISDLATKIESSLETVSSDIVISPSSDPIAPLSHSQKRIWFLQKLEGSKACTYNVHWAIEFRGNLDQEVLEKTLGYIISQHDVLRSKFYVSENGELEQKAEPQGKFSLLDMDLSSHSVEEQEKQLQNISEQQARSYFDLENDLPYKFLLVRCSNNSHILFSTLHHIICDGWSRWLLVQEIRDVYQTMVQQQALPDKKLYLQYKDFALWQSQQRQLSSDISFWEKHLKDVTPLRIPTHFNWPAIPDFTGDLLKRRLELKLSNDLIEFSQKQKVTLFTTMLSTFQILLHKWCRQTDVVCGTPIANRNVNSVEKLVGCFINTLALPSQIDPKQSFATFLHHSQTEISKAFQHREAPFEEVVKALRPVRNPARQPIIDVMFNMVNLPTFPSGAMEVSFEYPDFAPPQAKFPLSLYVREVDSVLELRLVFQKSLFESQRMVHFFDQYIYLLEQILLDSSISICDLKADFTATQVEEISKLERQPYETARTPIEEILIELWQNNLTPNRIGVHDNFFTLGGHSLLAVKLISQINRRFQIDLPLFSIFQTQTIGDLAILVLDSKMSKLSADQQIQLLDKAEKGPSE